MPFQFRQVGALALTGSLLAACSTVPPHIALPDPARDKIVSTEVVNSIKQHEIYVYVPPSTAGASGGAAFGFLGAVVGAVIDSSVNEVRSEKAETAVKSLRDAMVDYNFDDKLSADLKDQLSQVGFLGVDKVRVTRESTLDGIDKDIAGSTDGAILLAVTDYKLDNDANRLTMAVGVGLYANNDALRALHPSKEKKNRTAPPNALYRNTFVFVTRLDGLTGDRDKNIAAWSADHGAPARAALEMGSKRIAALIATDIALKEGEGKPPADAPVAKVVGIAGFPLEGSVIGSDADGKIVRFTDGTLAYVTTPAL